MPSGKKPAQWLLVVAVVGFIYLFIPEPTDLIPGLGWIDEMVAGSISLSAGATYLFRYWLFRKVMQKMKP